MYRRDTHAVAIAALSTVLLAAVVVPQPLWACGGCFSPPSPTTDQLVVQDAERVLFVRDPVSQQSTVWVEVRYSGLAKDFGWVLPVPKVPKVGVGSAVVFDALDARMQLRYALVQQPAENCRDAWAGCDPDGPQLVPGSGGFADAGSASGGGSAQVEVLSSGTTGPYDYVVIGGQDGDKLLTWLNDRGYATPAKAKPILQSHADKGDVFVAIKLSNGKGVNEIRPVTLQMDDAEPCVPLRLTSIASAEELAVVVTVAGPGRAVVKNHMDVEPNPLRMALTSSSGALSSCSVGGQSAQCRVPDNYAQVVASAIDEAEGRAFVTESALAGAEMAVFSPIQTLTAAPLLQVTDALQLAYFLSHYRSQLPLTAEVADVLAAHVALDGLMPGVEPLQALANLRACGQYFEQLGGFGPPCNLPTVSLTKDQLSAIPIAAIALADDVTSQVVKPVADIAAMLGKNQAVTRLSMRISPDEMDRDPIFAYNPALPLLAAERPVRTNLVCLDGWSNGSLAQRISIDGLGSWVFSGSNTTDARFAAAPFALKIQLLDEAGPPLLVSAAQAPLVDAAIAGATPGKPSLPKDLVLQTAVPWSPPQSDILVTKLGPWKQPAPWCTPKAGWVDGKLPPSGAMPAADASGDTAPTSGPVPGVDAQSGWTDAVSPQATAPATAKASDDGCRAAPQGPMRSTVLALATLVLAVIWSRRRHGA